MNVPRGTFLVNLEKYSKEADKNDAEIFFTLKRQALYYTPRADSGELAGMCIVKFMSQRTIWGNFDTLHARWACTNWEDCKFPQGR